MENKKKGETEHIQDREMNSPSPKKHKSKKAKKHKRDREEDILESSLTQTEVVSEEEVREEEEPQPSGPIETSLRYSPPEGFVSIGSEDLLTTRELQGKELILISAPEDFDIEELNSRRFNIKADKTDVHTKKIARADSEVGTEMEHGTPSLSGETYEFISHTVSDSQYHPVIYDQHHKSLSMAAGAKIAGQILITPGLDIPPLPNIPVPPSVKHEIPDGLKIRYQPFGSDDPIVTIEENSTPHKKKKKRKSQIKEDEEQEVSPSKKKKKKKSRSGVSDD